MAGCVSCHHYIDQTAEGQKWFDEFMLERLGTNDYNCLLIRANTPGKRDDALNLMYAKQLLKELNS